MVFIFSLISEALAFLLLESHTKKPPATPARNVQLTGTTSSLPTAGFTTKASARTLMNIIAEAITIASANSGAKPLSVLLLRVKLSVRAVLDAIPPRIPERPIPC